jgi:DNA-binding transcriptional regulator YhcF (GntR family)
LELFLQSAPRFEILSLHPEAAMAKDQVAGAIILDTLRERVVSGLYVGNWRSGERLPSIREIAEAESVDRKTAAAAYHRLEQEGLVRIRPRSGVYLHSPAPSSTVGPLERLHRQWLQHTFEGARALGLDTRTILRLVQEVAELEQTRIPVVECSWGQAELIAEELRDRLGILGVPYLLEDLRPGDPLLLEAPIVITTSYHAAEVNLVAPGKMIGEVTLAPEIFREIRARMGGGRLLIVVGDDTLASKLQSALIHCRPPEPQGAVRISSTSDRQGLIAALQEVDSVLIWPGAPRWVDEAIPPGVERSRPRRGISDSSLDRIQIALLDVSLRRLREANKSTGVAIPR